MYKSSQIGDVVNTDVTTVSITDDLRVIQEIFNYNNINYIPVLKGQQVKGMIARKDFQNLNLKLARKTKSTEAVLERIAATRLMNTNIIKLSTNNTIAQAIEIFKMGLFPSIPIVDESDCFVGVLTYKDLVHQISDKTQPAGKSRRRWWW